MIYIYALSDPDTGEIRYIGKSTRPKERLTNQCNEKSNTYRCHWIQSVLSRGKRPCQIILETLSDDANWQDREKWWIAYGKSQGWRLTNNTIGGDGVTGLSGDSLERLRSTWKGRKHKPESLIKIGQASKNRKFSTETLAKRSAKLKGRTFTKEHLDKIAEANSKFDSEKIEQVKQMLADGWMVKDIAIYFGVHRTTISKIKMGKYPK